MTIEQKMAKALIQNVGYEVAIIQTQIALDNAMERSSIKDIELQHFWREVLVEMLKTRH